MTFKNNDTKKIFEQNKRLLKKEFKNFSFIGIENTKLFFVGFDNTLRENETTPLLLFASDPGNKKTFARYTADYIRYKRGPLYDNNKNKF